MQQEPTACVILIGNEILSGRTQDKNLSYIGTELAALGITLAEARVIPDVEAVIIETVNHCRAQYDYVFTTGGIGPTHDDITSRCIAAAFGLPFGRNAEAQKILEDHYKHEINESRLTMADTPEGAELIKNPVSAAPGFRIENVYVLPGVPSIMQAMFMGLSSSLKGGTAIASQSFSGFVSEGKLAKGVGKIQDEYPQTDIGSYPFLRDGKLGTTLVVRSRDAEALQKAADALREHMQAFAEIIEE